MQSLVIINNFGMMINAGLNAKNKLTMVYVIRNLFGILVIVNVNTINHVILVSIYTIKIKIAEHNWLIN